MSTNPEAKAKIETKNPKIMVLLSGGIDSATALFLAATTVKDMSTDVIGISFDYGQRHVREIEHAMALCSKIGCVHKTLYMPAMPKSMLTDPTLEVPDISYDEISGVSPTYVPFRNGLMLSRAAAEAQSRGFHAIMIAVHGEDAHNWAYPDCTPEFVGAMANAIYVGTYGEVRLVAPFQHMMKSDIIKWGAALEVPYDLTWSCYKGEQYHCGKCPTCRARKEAFKKANVEDPTYYADESTEN